MSAYEENFFARGPSPLARLTFFSLIAIAVMVADHRFQALPLLRLGVSAVITPIEQALLFPGSVARRTAEYFTNQTQLIDENARLKTEVLELAAASQQSALIRAEQTYLGALAAADKRFGDRGIVAEIIRDARNPFARKVIIDKGLSQGLTAGLAVIDGKGVVGQVTAVGMLSSEVTLTTEKDQAVPVMVVRNGVRAIAVGTGREGTSMYRSFRSARISRWVMRSSPRASTALIRRDCRWRKSPSSTRTRPFRSRAYPPIRRRVPTSIALSKC